MHNMLLGWEPYVAFLGLILTFYALYLERRQTHYPSHITCYTHETIPLTHWISRSLPDLSILYRDLALPDSTVFVSAYLVHSGRRDISPDMVGERLALSVPEGFRWIAANIGEISHGLKATVSRISDTTLEFDLGLFRVGEYLEFVALLDGPANSANNPASDPAMKRILRFQHRITDTGPVERKSLASIRGRNLRMLCITSAVFLLTLLSATITYFDLGGVTRTLAFYRIAAPGMLVQTEVVPNADGSVSFRSDDGLKATGLRGDQFSSQYRWSVSSERSPLYPWVAVLFTVYLLLAGALLAHQGWKHYHFSRLPQRLRLKHA